MGANLPEEFQMKILLEIMDQSIIGAESNDIFVQWMIHLVSDLVHKVLHMSLKSKYAACSKLDF